jgi:hypothetical protein
MRHGGAKARPERGWRFDSPHKAGVAPGLNLSGEKTTKSITDTAAY